MLIVTVLLAAALLGAGGALQVRRTRRSVSAVRALLMDRDRSRRLLGVERAEQEGVALHAVALYRAAARERDPLVVDALAAAVRRALWEPTQSPEVKALRRWAASCPTAADGAHADPAHPHGDGGAAVVVPAAFAPAPAPPTLGETIRMIIAEPLLLVRLHCDDAALEAGSKSDAQALAG